MKVENKPDFPVDDIACKEATGKTLAEWFQELDSVDGLKIGRRDGAAYIHAQTSDPWWPTTIYVEFEAHHGVVKKDGKPEGYTICVTKSIKAPVDQVYRAYTEPKNFAEFFGDGGTQDVKEGGSLQCGAGCKGTFVRVRPDKDLRFMWEHPGITMPVQIDVMFQDNKGKTLMNVMPSRLQTRGEADGLRTAWADALGRLKEICES